MPLHKRYDVAYALAELEADYWYEVDHRWGRLAAEMYVEAGVFAIGEQCMTGRAAIRAFYQWREGRGERTARHIFSNFRVTEICADSARADCILCLYAADGLPVLESKPPIMIADIVSEYFRDSDGHWRFRSHLLQPVFMGGAPPTIPPSGGQAQ